MNYRTNNIAYSALLSLLVTIGLYLVFFFFMLYEGYISADMPEAAPGMPAPGMPAPDSALPPHGGRHPLLWQQLVISCVSSYLMAFLLYVVSFRIMFDEHHSRKSHIWSIFVFALVVVALFASLGVLVDLTFFGKDMPPKSHHSTFHLFRILLSRDATVAVIVVATASIIHYSHREEEYKALTVDAQYEALKSKLDPHFLFNALNSLSSLIASGSDRSLEYVDKLSAIYRFTLNHPKQVHLGSEVTFVRNYADLMQIRYEDALVVKIDVPDALSDHMVFPFSLQTLVENAIKHNTITLKSPLTVSISAEDDYVVVSNPVHPRLDVDNTPGIGLRLLSQQYANCGKAVLIDHTPDTFTVKIPLL